MVQAEWKAVPAELIELLEFMIHSFGQSVIVENGNQRQRRCEDTGNMQKRVTRRRRFRALKAGKVLESYGRKEIISEVQQTNAPSDWHFPFLQEWRSMVLDLLINS